jgi:hypothetical protein
MLPEGRYATRLSGSPYGPSLMTRTSARARAWRWRRNGSDVSRRSCYAAEYVDGVVIGSAACRWSRAPPTVGLGRGMPAAAAGVPR